VWVAEVVLQQTRVAQGLDYYHRFLAHFPTVGSLASADEAAVLKVWEGLGYYSRARNMRRAAQAIMAQHSGLFPKKWEQLAQLPGFGPYTARAVASFAFSQPVAVLDGNVFRVASRVLADPTPIDRPANRQHYQALADAWLGNLPSPDFNNAMMDLGATVCTPRSPACPQCPVARHCVAFARGQVAHFPVKAARKQAPTRYADVLWATNAYGALALLKQTGKGVWNGLWFPPLLLWPPDATPANPPPAPGKVVGWVTHVFSHYTLQMRVVQTTKHQIIDYQGLEWVTKSGRSSYPLPAAFSKVERVATAAPSTLFS
jgi:A/G-specific adenine glycosylase